MVAELVISGRPVLMRRAFLVFGLLFTDFFGWGNRLQYPFSC